jgi:hypothetical protein
MAWSPSVIQAGDHIGGFKVERAEQTPSGGTRLHLEGGGRILLGPHDHGPNDAGHLVHRPVVAAASPEAAALARKLQAENPALTVTDAGSRVVARHLDEYARLPDGVRKLLGAKGTKVNFGARPVTELGLGDLADVHPRGYAPGQTWKDSAGAHSPSKNLLAIGNGTATYASANMPAHEAGHAVDHFLNGSGNPDFVKLHDSANQVFGTRMSPYFTTAGNPDGARKEFFAETFAKWVNTQQPGLGYTPTQVARLIMTAVGATAHQEPAWVQKLDITEQVRIGKALAKHYASLARQAARAAKG